MVKIAIAGAGRWGINHVRAFHRAKADVRVICDPSEEARTRARAIVPDARLESDFLTAITADDVDAVVLATPAKSHAELAIAAIRAGKHVFVEKPLALSTTDAQAITDAAEKHGRILMVGHLMLFHPAVERMKKAIEDGEIGRVFYLYGRRVNLGTLRRDENALWSLAPHDISILLHLLGEEPVSVSACGGAYLQAGIHDVAFVSLRFGSGILAQIQLSWLDPLKERRLVIVGEKKMMEFDDSTPQNKLKIHDKGYDREPAFTEYSEFLAIRSGDVHIPSIPAAEPLDVECRHFLDCVAHRKQPLTDGRNGVRVVRVLEAAQASVLSGGAPIAIEPTP